MSLAKVVFPEPGGPQKIREGKESDFKSLTIIPFVPTRCVWPINSLKFFGRSVSASGICAMSELYPKLREILNVVKSTSWGIFWLQEQRLF